MYAHLTAARRRSCAHDLFVNQSDFSLPNPGSWKLILICLYI